MIATIDEFAIRIAHGMDWQDLLDQGAASCVASHGCNGVTQGDLIKFARRLLENQSGEESAAMQSRKPA